MMIIRLLFIAALLIPQPTSYPAHQDRDTLESIASRIIDEGYRQHDSKLHDAIGELDRLVDDRAYLVSYWRGYAYWRLADSNARGSGTSVEMLVNRSVRALEQSVERVPEFAESHALLSALYDRQMQFHHDDTVRYVQLTAASLASARELAPDNPRVILAHARDLLRTPVQYGGSIQRGIAKLQEARQRFQAESRAQQPTLVPAWGVVDLELALGDAYLALHAPEEAELAFEAALALVPDCAEALERGLPASRQLANTLEAPQYAVEPLPPPAPDDENAMAGWSRWRGPRRDGMSHDRDWSAEGTEVWRRDLGLGYSGVVLSDGRLFTKGYALDTGKDVVFALNARTGEELWRYSYVAALWNEMHEGGTLSTPVVDGERVYTLNREGRLHCFRADNGDVLWERQLVDEEALRLSRWGFAASPVVIGEQLVLNVGRVISLDKHSGVRQWRTRHFGDAYSTPTPFLSEGQHLLAAFNATGLVVINLGTGREVAQYAWETTYDQNCASPLVIDGDRIFISSGMNRGCAMLAFTGGKLTPIWESRVMRNTMSGSVAKDGYLYGFDNRDLKCVDVDGRERWIHRGLGWGAISLAGDRLIVVSEEGQLIIADASPDRFAPIDTAQVFESGKGWATPVLVNGLLYVRSSSGELVCREH